MSPHKIRLLNSGLAYIRTGEDKKPPGFLWLGGLHSTMQGTKASALAQWAYEAQHPFVRFDYHGHGNSTGTFTEGTLSVWRQDATEVLTSLTCGKQVLIGSSMGGWLALLLALAFPERIYGLLLIAPSVNFTQRLADTLSPEAQERLATHGQISLETSQGPLLITRTLLEDAQHHLLEDHPLAVRCPVHIFHGLQDTSVSWRESVRLLTALPQAPTRLLLSSHSDHSFSSPQDLQQLTEAAQNLMSPR